VTARPAGFTERFAKVNGVRLGFEVNFTLWLPFGLQPGI
jgi:hypothetical protein